MRQGARVGLVAALLSCLTPLGVHADSGPPVPVHVGNHPGYGRVVFELPERLDYHLTQQGQHVLVRFTGDVTIGSAPSIPHNVLGVTGGAGQAELVVESGTVVRAWRLGDLVVVDVLDQAIAANATPARVPVPTSAPGAASRDDHATSSAGPAAPASSNAVAPETGRKSASPPSPAPPLTSAEKQTDAPVVAKPAPDAPRPADPALPRDADLPAPTSPPLTAPIAPVSAVASTPVSSVSSAPTPDGTLEVGFEAAVGVAAFRRGNSALVVFDQQLSLDLASWRDDPVFGSATIQQLPTATVIRLHLEPDKALSLSQAPHVWRITVVPIEPKLLPIHATAANGRLVMPAAAPGRVVSLTDPDSGATLLVGTQRQAGQGAPVVRRGVEYVLMPTWQGIAVEPISDEVALRPVQDGFVVAGDANGLALSPTPDAANFLVRADALTRRFDFAALPADALMQRLRRQVADDAATPALGRGPGRRAAAQTMISLGLGAEAQAMLQLATADDPHEAADADNAALTGMAAVLAHRANEAAGLDDERLSGTDDIALWRAAHIAEQQEGSPQAAAVFAATLPLVLAYPSPLRDRLLPLVAETLVTGGETAAASALLAERKDDPALGLARGMLQEARGETVAALATYDAQASSRDRSLYARSAMRALELRLASGGIDAKQAADGMDKQLYAWRGDLRERSLRERLAELRARAGAWRAALGLLRETEAIFPADKAAVHAELGDMFAAMLRDDSADALPPLELTALVEENSDLLPVGPAGDLLQARLADRLLALDLPKRADPVLHKLMLAAPSDVSRAGFGARLAALRLREGDPSGALAALAASNAEDPPADLAERRTLLLASAHARLGEADRALAVLSSLDTPSADEARATILERANDWPAAEKALTAYTAKVVPTEGKLDDIQRRSLLRLATAAARAGDDATLTALRQSAGSRMESGPLADMFRLLTADQVRNVGDLKRSGQEAVLARELPSQLKAVQSPPGQSP
ncbi:MAG TPA: hypothetical protein VNW90_11065 [Acetobacteraceae bacterium]|nr:hypothetical protein [Acetobacteraceae bacterium]